MALETVVVNLRDFFLAINYIQIVYTSLCKLSEGTCAASRTQSRLAAAPWQRLGQAGVGLQENYHGKECTMGTALSGKDERCFISCRTHLHLCCTVALLSAHSMVLHGRV